MLEADLPYLVAQISFEDTNTDPPRKGKYRIHDPSLYLGFFSLPGISRQPRSCPLGTLCQLSVLILWEHQGTVDILSNETIKFGRDPDNEKNNVFFSDPTISRNHAEIYSVIIDDDCRHAPLVFVRDRQSFNGTFVNRQLIGKGPHITPGRLLKDKDLIHLSPNVALQFRQTRANSPPFCLSSQQQKEVSVCH